MKRTVIILMEVGLFALLMAYFYFSQQGVLEGLKHPWVRHIVNYVLYVVVIDLAMRSIKYFYSKKHGLARDYKDNFHYGIDNIGKVLLGVGFIVTVFAMFGIDFRALITSLSIVAAAIAIISKEYVNDFLVGLYFSFSRNIEIGDYVKMGEHKGKIQELEMLKIKLLNDDDDIVIIPNSKVYTNEIINYTKKDIRLMSIDFQLDIKSVKNMEIFEKELKRALVDFAEFIEADSYNLKIVEMKKDYVDFKFQYKLAHIDRDLQREIRRRTVRKVFSYVSSRRGAD